MKKKDKKLEWETKKVPLSSIKEFEHNPRQLTKKQYQDLKKSLQKFDYVEVAAIDYDNTLIAGHQRLRVLRDIKGDDIEIDVRFPNRKLTEKEFKEYLVRSNKNTGDWDYDVLANTYEIGELIEYGFTEEELQVNEAEYIEEDETEGDDDIPEKAPALTVKGDLYQLGGHRLLCGDSTMIDDVEKLMDGEKADMVFTDPPYKIEGSEAGKGYFSKNLNKQKDSIEFISSCEPSGFLNVLPTVFSKNKINSYIFCNAALLPDYLTWAKNNKYSFNVLVWKKPNSIPINAAHHPDIEYLLLFRKGSIFNYGLEGVNYSRCVEHNKVRGLHPTMKPIELIVNQIKIGSNSESILTDFFLGSGSTLIACEKTNRKCYGLELSEKYCDVIVKRYVEFCKKNNKKYEVIRNGEKCNDFE